MLDIGLHTADDFIEDALALIPKKEKKSKKAKSKRWNHVCFNNFLIRYVNTRKISINLKFINSHIYASFYPNVFRHLTYANFDSSFSGKITLEAKSEFRQFIKQFLKVYFLKI